jgi:DNA-binding transcriptional regulator YiaG
MQKCAKDVTNNVLAPKKRRAYRRRMRQGAVLTTELQKTLAQIAGVTIRAARESLGLSTNAYAKAHNLTPYTMYRIEAYDPAHFNPKKMIRSSWTKAQVCQDLGLISPDILQQLQPSDVSGMTPPSQDKTRNGINGRGATYDLPLHRPRLIESGVMALAAGREQRIKKPQYLSFEPEYAIEIPGEDMAPLFNAGDVIHCTSKLTPRIGKAAVFLSGDRKRMQVWILAGSEAATWLVRKANSEALITTLSKSDWPYCDAIGAIEPML